ncbi:MAG: CopG family antitoxin [Ktedonobacteraceae bacterium]
MNSKYKPIPHLDSEEEVREFWATHDSTEYIDWSKAVETSRTIMTEHTCYIENFPHRLPHQEEAQLRPCGHYACNPHTITYFGRGDDDELIGDYCLVCYARTFPQNCPNNLIRQAILQESEHAAGK